MILKSFNKNYSNKKGVKLIIDQKSYNQNPFRLSQNTTSDLKMYNKLSASSFSKVEFKQDKLLNSEVTKTYSNVSASAADLKATEYKTVHVVKKEYKSMFQRDKDSKLLEM